MSSKKTVEPERRALERAAPRLASAVPSLTALRILVQEWSGTGSVTYRKHVIVGSAPALFLLPCGDERCQDGGYDITRVVMNALRAGAALADGEHACEGRIGTANCARRISFKLVAEYQPAN